MSFSSPRNIFFLENLHSNFWLITDSSDPGPAGTLNTIYTFLCFFSYYFLFHFLEGAERSTVR